MASIFRVPGVGGEISLSSPVSCLISGCTDTVQDDKGILLLSHCVLFIYALTKLALFIYFAVLALSLHVRSL